MSGGHIRFNGSFIKRLPMPENFPESLSYLGKINQFLSQILNEQSNLLLNSQEISKYYNFFTNISDSLVSLLYLKELLDKPKLTNLLKLPIYLHDLIYPNLKSIQNKNYNLIYFQL